jgi:hypothetical protein
MNRLSSVLLFGSGLLVVSLAANAQGAYPQRDDPYYPNEGNRGYNGDDRFRQRGYYPDQNRYGNDRYGDGRNQNSLIGRVLADLNRAASNARLDGHERKHFEEAADKLQEFEGRWAQGKFDSGKLDKAIQNLQHLADADRVRGRDRDMLARDVADLRQFRSTRGRYLNNGYGDYRDDRYNQNRRYDPNWR